ncbi:MAG: 50S ribosomal protein L18 [Anaerolineae bacterium]|nr:50S ribosomal protein L18 [Anaerolineae bacterium]
MAKTDQKRVARLRRHRRVRAKLSGTDARPRLNVFRSSEHIYVQIIDDKAGHTLVAASSIDGELRKQCEGLNKTEAARIVGKTIAERAKQVGVTTVVFDRGGWRYQGRVRALAEGAREGGLEF